MAEKRISPRVSIRSTVFYGTSKETPHTAFMVDMSDTGICIKTNNVFRPGTKVFMKIATKDRDYMAEGVVAWAKRVPPRLATLVKNGMGVRFTTIDRDLIKLYRDRVDYIS